MICNQAANQLIVQINGFMFQFPPPSHRLQRTLCQHWILCGGCRCIKALNLDCITLDRLFGGIPNPSSEMHPIAKGIPKTLHLKMWAVVQGRPICEANSNGCLRHQVGGECPMLSTSWALLLLFLQLLGQRGRGKECWAGTLKKGRSRGWPIIG